MKKLCGNCKIKKSVEEFNKKSVSKDGLNSQCKDCNKIYLKNHYLKNKEGYLKRNQKKREKLKKWFINYKQTLKCSICPESRYWVLDFHHRDPSKKDGDVYKLLMTIGKNKGLKEMEKCDVLCANCHRDVHYHMNNE